jgi:hypothetical protein
MISGGTSRLTSGRWKPDTKPLGQRRILLRELADQPLTLFARRTRYRLVRPRRPRSRRGAQRGKRSTRRQNSSSRRSNSPSNPEASRPRGWSKLRRRKRIGAPSARPASTSGPSRQTQRLARSARKTCSGRCTRTSGKSERRPFASPSTTYLAQERGAVHLRRLGFRFWDRYIRHRSRIRRGVAFPPIIASLARRERGTRDRGACRRSRSAFDSRPLSR